MADSQLSSLTPHTIEVQRQQLFKAAGVIAVARAALATKLEVDEESIIDALAVAGDIVDSVAGDLERIAATDHD